MPDTTIIPLDLQNLDQQDLEAYQALIEKKYWKCLQGVDPWGIDTAEIYAFGAISSKGQPIGLALATYYPNLSLAKLIRFEIIKEFSTNELSIRLLRSLEDKLKSLNCYLLTYLFPATDPEYTETNRIFKEAGWSDPSLLIVRCHFNVKEFHPAWLDPCLKILLPQDFKIFPWRTLKPKDVELLKHQQEEKTFPLGVSPLHDEKSIEYINSLGIRYKGNVIGWIITNRIDRDTVSFSSFYLDRDFRGSKVALSMLARSINLLKKTSIPKAVLEFNLSQVDKYWIGFVKKKLVPHATKVERLYEVCLFLREDKEEDLID